MDLKKNIFRNAGAGIFGKGAMILFRLVQVPLLLSFLGVDNYGRWLVIYSLPSWLSLANLGFGSVASNEMSISVSGGDYERANRLYSTTFALLLALLVFGGVIVSLIVPFISWEIYLKDIGSKHSEIVGAIIILAFNVLFSFYGELFGGRFRAAQKAHQAILISSIRPWVELGMMLLMLTFSTRFDYLAFSILISTLIYILTKQYTSYKVIPILTFHFKNIDKRLFASLFKKGVAFQAFPLGNALLFQGTIMIVQIVLGPASVVLFGTARTLIRTISQGMELVNNTIWPELSHLFGCGDVDRIRKLHRIAVGISLIISTGGSLVIAIIGPSLYRFWIGKTLELPYHLLLLFLLSVPINALWLTSSVIHMASNKHEKLASRYLIANFLCVICCYLLAKLQGIEGAAFATIVVDLCLAPFVLKKSLEITHDTWSRFVIGMFHEFKEIYQKTIKTLQHT